MPDSNVVPNFADDQPDIGRRFGGLARLYGAAGADRIRRSHLVIVGLGGVGSWAAEAAARSGVSQLTLIDLDHIAIAVVPAAGRLCHDAGTGCVNGFAFVCLNIQAQVTGHISVP